MQITVSVLQQPQRQNRNEEKKVGQSWFLHNNLKVPSLAADAFSGQPQHCTTKNRICFQGLEPSSKGKDQSCGQSDHIIPSPGFKSAHSGPFLLRLRLRAPPKIARVTVGDSQQCAHSLPSPLPRWVLMSFIILMPLYSLYVFLLRIIFSL